MTRTPNIKKGKLERFGKQIDKQIDRQSNHQTTKKSNRQMKSESGVI